MSTIHIQAPINDDASRNSTSFYPSVWGNHFLNYVSQSLEIDVKTEGKVQKLKEEVKRMFAMIENDPPQKLKLIDTIQLLGLSHHFENEIAQDLSLIHKAINVVSNSDNLFIVSLSFRLLRQGGYNISNDVFKKFTNEEGKFKKSLIADIEGMLCLYEAAHMAGHEEDILEEALAFTTPYLQSLNDTNTLMSPFLSAQINHALRHPIQKAFPRLYTRHYIPIYELDPSHSEALVTFAKIYFNIVQRVHQKELGMISKWWTDLEFASKYSFIRDRVVEGYFWILGVYIEPEYALARSILIKVFCMTSIIDDIYDNYGTFEELQILAKAIKRWDVTCVASLPNYIKDIYKELLHVYEEAEEELAKDGRDYRIRYGIDKMKQLVQAYFTEANWFHNNYTPTLEEYLKTASVSAGYLMLTTTSFIGMKDTCVTEEAFDWVSAFPKIVRGSANIARILNDVVGHKFEQSRGHVVSSVECYVKQHNATEEEAYKELRKQVADAWKDINEEMIDTNKVVPISLLTRVVNFARVSDDVVYVDEDRYTDGSKGAAMRKYVSSVLIEPILI